MNKNVLIVLAGAMIVAVLVAMLVQLTLSGGQEEAVVQKEERVEVLVATKNLPIGKELLAEDLAWQEWPKNSVFSGAIIRDGDQAPSDSVEGRLARYVAEGEPVQRSALVTETKRNFVAASLNPGMRAVAIEVSASSMVGGFIEPGDHVDVILTYKESIRTDDDDPRVKTLLELSLDKLATETILQNVRVLAIDQSATRGKEGDDEAKAKVGKTVTLAVSAQDAERLSLAAEMGDLMLSLRGIGDNEIVTKDWRTISDARLTTVGDEIFEDYEKLKNDAGINRNIVRIYNGSQIHVVPTR